jgi:hypothetical protein
MHAHPAGFEKFHHPQLNRSIQYENFECFFTAGDEWIIDNIIGEKLAVESNLQIYYQIDHIPHIVIYIYHDLQAMNEAFKRGLPNDQCCFVPIKGNISLITFTSKIGVESIKPVLTHEISHIIFSFLSGNQEVNNIQQTVPLWLDEGIALYLDIRFRKNKKQIEENRLCLLKNSTLNYFPRLSSMYTYFNRLDDPIEFGPKGMMSYAYSYFCVLYLINTFGSAAVVDFIKNLKNNKRCFDRSFERHFNLSLDEFDNRAKSLILSEKKDERRQADDTR